MIRSLILGASLFLSIPSMANINGSWAGTGEWKYGDSLAQCNAVRLELNEDDNSLTRVKGSLNCDVINMEMPELRFEKNGQDLVKNGSTLGHIDGNTYSWVEVYNENVKVRIKLIRDADQIDYSETWMDNTFPTPDHLLYEVHAKLSAQKK